MTAVPIKADVEYTKGKIKEILHKIRDVNNLHAALSDLSTLTHSVEQVANDDKQLDKQVASLKAEAKIKKSLSKFKDSHKKARKKLLMAKTLTPEELVHFVHIFHDQTDDWMTNHLATKRLVYKKTGFRFVRYYKQHIRLQGLEHVKELEQAHGWIPIDAKRIEEVVERNLKNMKRTGMTHAEHTQESVLAFITTSLEEGKSDKFILKSMHGFGIKADDKMIAFDGYHKNHLHIRGFPKDVWVPAEKHALSFAAILYKRLEEIEHDLGANKPMSIDSIKRIVSGKAADGKPVTDDMLEQLSTWDSKLYSEQVIKALRLARKFLVVR